MHELHAHPQDEQRDSRKNSPGLNKTGVRHLCVLCCGNSEIYSYVAVGANYETYRKLFSVSFVLAAELRPPGEHGSRPNYVLLVSVLGGLLGRGPPRPAPALLRCVAPLHLRQHPNECREASGGPACAGPLPRGNPFFCFLAALFFFLARNQNLFPQCPKSGFLSGRARGQIPGGDCKSQNRFNRSRSSDRGTGERLDLGMTSGKISPIGFLKQSSCDEVPSSHHSYHRTQPKHIATIQAEPPPQSHQQVEKIPNLWVADCTKKAIV